MRRSVSAALLAGGLLIAPAPSLAGARSLGFRQQQLDLPGMPAAVIPADLTGDGRDDLAVLVAYTEWASESEFEEARFEGVEGLVEVMNVVTGLFDRRELWIYPALEAGGYGEPLPPLELDTSVHALEAGEGDEPLLAITDEGVAAVRLPAAETAGAPRLVPVLARESSLTGSELFVSDLRFRHDLNGDGRDDLVLPTADGWTIHAATAAGFLPEPSALLERVVPASEDNGRDDTGDEPPAGREERVGGADGEGSRGAPADDEPVGDETATDDDGDKSETKDRSSKKSWRLPQVEDLNGDARPDLFALRPGSRSAPVVYLNTGSPSFSLPIELSLPAGSGDQEFAYLGDLDGDGLAELVTQQEIEPPDDAGFRREIDAAKRPTFVYRLYRLEPDGAGLAVAGRPYREFTAIGYAFEGEHHHDEDDDGERDIDVTLPGGFKDLDGDGRDDLVAITLDFSIVPLIARALFTRRLSLGMDFHPWCQESEGGFSEVPNLDLSGKFKINLRNIQVKHLSQFAGDFNGDGRKDFVQLGRGKRVTIHQGGPDCTYPPRPDRKIKLDREPKHLGLVRILDLDGDGRSDLYVVHPLKDPETGESIPARVDLYLSES